MITLNPGTHKDKTMFPFMAEEGYRGHSSYKVSYLDTHGRCTCSEYKTKQICVHSVEYNRTLKSHFSLFLNSRFGKCGEYKMATS